MFDLSSDGLHTPNFTLAHPPSPPLTKILASIESTEERDVVLGTSPNSLTRPSEQLKAVSTNSAEFLLTPKERVPLKPDTDFSPDPFNRALSSPTAPVKEAFIEHVGGFDITNLRRDSYGALPKISSHSASAVSSETPVHETSQPPMSTAILPGQPRCRPTPVRRAGLDLPRPFPPNVPFPTPTAPRQVLVRELVTGRQREPKPFLMKSQSTTGLTPAYVFAEYLVCTRSGSRNSSLTSLLEWDWLGRRVRDGPIAPGLVRRLSGSVDASRDSLRGHLGAGLRRTSEGVVSRRMSSAWAVSEGSLGLLVDVDGEVEGQGR